AKHSNPRPKKISKVLPLEAITTSPPVLLRCCRCFSRTAAAANAAAASPRVVVKIDSFEIPTMTRFSRLSAGFMVFGGALSCIRGGCGAQEIWQPETNATWQWWLQYEVDTSFDVDMYDVDLFDVEVSTFDEIKANGSVVICYFSAGTKEDWRDDADDFPEEALGEPLGDWEGEVWLDVTNEIVREVMAARLDTAALKGCDGVEPDNMQVYAEAEWGMDTGVNVTADEQMAYSIFLATEAHSRNLSIGLKNDLYHLAELESYFDWAINESCFEWNECDGYTTTFIAAGKAVFHTEYESNLTFCAEANAMGMSSLLKAYDLGPARCSCQDPTTNSQCTLLVEEGEVPPLSSDSSTVEDDDETAGARAKWTAS
ncbi:unnamed protein product, partial [Scytosiphon promiscuus]